MLFPIALHKRKLFFALIAMFGAGTNTFAGEFEVSGSHNFVRSPGKPESQTVDFPAPVEGPFYVLRIYNGENAAELVTAARVMLNGIEYFEPSDFKKSATYLDTPILPLELNNSLYVMLDGQPGSGLTAEVIGIDNTLPSITADIDPEANLAGWHNSDVTVSFNCEDELSGIESCTSPVVFSSEGSSQEITGQAIDKAGNTAEINVTVSLDKTPPTLISQIFPQANEHGWYNQPVNITYTCEDSLSGVSSCPNPTTADIEGDNQLFEVIGTDIAGNIADVKNILNIDLTPPVISAQLSSTPNANGWFNSPVTVNYSCSDMMSGIASCDEAVVLISEGANQTVTGNTVDFAGNSSSTSVIFSLDTTAPELNFISPLDKSLLKDKFPKVQVLLTDNIEIDINTFVLEVTGVSSSECSIDGLIATCSLLQPISDESEIVFTASVNDSAGNNTTASITTAIDSDHDTVADYLDECSNTPHSQSVNETGCALSQLDSDNDGINDAEEIAAGSNPQDPTSFPPLNITSFSATPSEIETKSQSVELQWEVNGADTLVISNDADDQVFEVHEMKGKQAVSPLFTTNYTLTATGPAGEIKQTITVTLDVPAPPELWTEPTVPVQEKIATSLAVSDDGSAYLGAFDGNFYKVNSRGEVEWTFENSGLVMGKAAITGNQIIFGANINEAEQPERQGRVYALSSDKQPLWSFATEGAVVAGPLLSQDANIAYIVTYSGHLYALRTRDGAVMWSYVLPEDTRVTTSPALADEKLILHTEGKKIYALDSRSEIEGDRILWSRNLN